MRQTTLRARRGIVRARRIWAELDYAQRRSLEIQTGIPLGARDVHPRIRRSFDELSRLRAA
ncbi:MAG: hypothetical protein ACTHMY_28090 [Solirubrobacteraceae bacterium]